MRVVALLLLAYSRAMRVVALLLLAATSLNASPILASFPESGGTVVIPQPIEVAEPIVLPEDLEEKQDTVVRQTSSSGKLQHILRAHFVGRADNEQRFEVQDAAEPVPVPRSPQVSLNDAYFKEVDQIASATLAPVQQLQPLAPFLPAQPVPGPTSWPYPGYSSHPWGTPTGQYSYYGGFPNVAAPNAYPGVAGFYANQLSG